MIGLKDYEHEGFVIVAGKEIDMDNVCCPICGWKMEIENVETDVVEQQRVDSNRDMISCSSLVRRRGSRIKFRCRKCDSELLVHAEKWTIGV